MKKAVAQVRIISAFEVCRNHVNFGGKVTPQPTATRMSATPPPPPPSLPIPTPNPRFGFGFGFPELNLNRQSPTFLSFFGNPCLDLFFRVVEPNTPAKQQANINYLNQLLPLAWSHNPLTTLKLICNLLYDSNYRSAFKNDFEGFYAAAAWLYKNHPKTLACNLPAIAGEFLRFDDILIILYRALEGQEAGKDDSLRGDVLEEMLREGMEEDIEDMEDNEEEMIAMAKKALQRYDKDPAYRFLHDRVSDLFAHCLKSDIEKFRQLQLELELKKKDDEQSQISDLPVVELTTAGFNCPYVDSIFDRATLLAESIAKKVFPRISYQGVEEEEAEHAERARGLLMEEVLVPLSGPLDIPEYQSDINQSGYLFPTRLKGKPCPVRKYLEEVKAGGKSAVKPGEVLPHEIVECVYFCDELRQVAELQWKTMVEEIYLKQGKFKNCLAVCDVSGNMMRIPLDLSVALGILVSELSEEPWNGKVITFNRNPQLHSIQGDDLRSKCAFVRRMDSQDWHCEVDFRKVFDLILEVAVNGDLKPEQMVKRVFVFTVYFDFDEISANRWDADYEVIQNKFKEKGYTVPHLVVWNLSQDKTTAAVPCTQPGVTMVYGFINNNLVKSFLDNDGDIGAQQAMEAALSPVEYQSLVVVD